MQGMTYHALCCHVPIWKEQLTFEKELFPDLILCKNQYLYS